MIRLKHFIQSFGIFRTFDIKSSDIYNAASYSNSKKKTLLLHKEYLKEIEKEEENRLTIIENKTSQLIGQTGLIFSLLSIFIPFIIDKILYLNFYIKILFIIVLFLAYLSYILAINNSLKNFNVKKFKYVKKSPKSVLSHQNSSIKDFLKMEIKDSLYAISNNININNHKATNLITAYNSFKFGNIFTSILVVLLCISLLFIKTKPNEIKLENPIEIKQFKEFINKIEKQNSIIKEKKITIKKDTI